MGSAEWGSDSASFASTPRCRSRPPASASVAPPKPSSRTIGRPLARLPRVAAHETTPPPPFASHWPERSRSSAPPLLRRCGASRPSTPITRPGRSTSWRPSSAKKASVGMTPAMVEVALGKPTEVQSRVGKVGPAEGWIDRKSSAALRGLLRRTGLSVRGGGVSTGTPGRRASSTTPTNADDQEIVFRRGPGLRGASSPAPRARRPPPHQWSNRLPQSHSTAPPSAATKKTPGSWREPAARRAKSRMR